MELKQAIAELKELKLCIIGRSQRIWIDREACEAIDTVVSHYEKSEKIEFFKSAKQPSEITHPYDLSKKYGTKTDGSIFYIDEDKLNQDHINQIRNYLNSREKLLKARK